MEDVAGSCLMGRYSLVAVAWVLAAGCGTSGEVGEPSSAEECPAVEVNGGGGISDPPDGARALSRRLLQLPDAERLRR